MPGPCPNLQQINAYSQDTYLWTFHFRAIAPDLLWKRKRINLSDFGRNNKHWFIRFSYESSMSDGKNKKTMHVYSAVRYVCSHAITGNEQAIKQYWFNTKERFNSLIMHIFTQSKIKFGTFQKIVWWFGSLMK